MANPYLPGWEYIPDGEPRVFGDRIYIYGSHDRTGHEKFCEYILKVWSAPVSNPGNWVCHGVVFSTRDTDGHVSDVEWSDNELYAPDVVCRDGKYYLYAYIVGAKGCVAVADRPEGPFTLLSRYEYHIDKHFDDGIFIDPGVLVDDDGQVYIYCGYLGSYMAQINPENMYEIIDGSYRETILPVDGEQGFFEACSPRKVGDTYYLIYSPKIGSRLDYAVSDSPLGPFEPKGTIIDNGIEYPGGNNHGSICEIGGQWYIFYHRMTNGTVMSRRGCVERIRILPDGTIPQVEMTSLGFEDALNPYRVTSADTACVLTGGCIITERNEFERSIIRITDGCVMGWKYFDFGMNSGSCQRIKVKIKGRGCRGKIHVFLDAADESAGGRKICELTFGSDDAVLCGELSRIEGKHALYLKAEADYEDWGAEMLKGRELFELTSFLFLV